ncbi:MAG: class II aldolase/adducin family protein [Chloroflexi bacterium]|nr:class II aldolase/adducin family protein [Chloroflexota bacterium]
MTLSDSPYTDEARARQAVVDVVLELYDARLITSTGGNVSVRLADGDILITPTRMHKGGLTPEVLVRVAPSGEPRPGQGRPSSETPLHLAVYRARPDVHAVVHTHAPHAIMLGLLEGRVPPIIADALPFEHLPVVYYVLPGDQAGIARIVRALDRGAAVLLKHHGLLTVGSDLRRAVNVTFALEEVLHILTLCRIWGCTDPPTLPPDDAETLRRLDIV